MDEEIVLLANPQNYGFREVICGFAEPSLTFDPKKRLFCVGDGRAVDVDCKDVVPISLSKEQICRLFPLIV